MNGMWKRIVPVLGLLVAAGAARAGVDAELVFRRIAAPKAPVLMLEDGKSVSIAGEQRALLVQRADPDSLKPGEAVSLPRQGGGDGTPLWLLAGEDEKQVALLAVAMEVQSPAAKRIGGIGTCSIYTPCPKCAAWASENRSRRRLHPPALRVREVPVSELKAGQLLMPDPQLTGGTPIVLADEQTGKVVNDIRWIATRARMMTQ